MISITRSLALLLKKQTQNSKHFEHYTLNCVILVRHLAITVTCFVGHAFVPYATPLRPIHSQAIPMQPDPNPNAAHAPLVPNISFRIEDLLIAMRSVDDGIDGIEI